MEARRVATSALILAVAGCGAAAVPPRPAPAVTITKVITRTVTRKVPGPTVTVTVRPTAAATQPAGPPTPDINGATWDVTVNCSSQQCTALPHAGPGGSTCGAEVNGSQVCAGYGAANYQTALSELGQ